MNNDIKLKVNDLLQLARDTDTSVLVIATNEGEGSDVDILSVVSGNLLTLVASIVTILTNNDEESKKLSKLINIAVDSARDYKLNNNENE